MGRDRMNSWISALRRRFGQFRKDADWQEELQSHLDLLTEEQSGRGHSPEEARRRARLSLGNPKTLMETLRDQEAITVFDNWRQDVVVGVRTLRHRPVFTVAAILTLAIGIGANTAIFSLLYGLLLRSLPVPHPQQLVRIGLTGAGRNPATSMPYRMWQQMRAEQNSFTGMSAWRTEGVTLADQEGALRQYVGGLVSGNAFEVLGLQAHLGRLLIPSDDMRGGPSHGWPVVLSYGFWQDRFGGNRQILGRVLKIGEASKLARRRSPWSAWPLPVSRACGQESTRSSIYPCSFSRHLPEKTS